MARTVEGLMDSPEGAQRVVNELMHSGFRRADIGLTARGPHSELTGAQRGERHGEEGGTLVTVVATDDEMAGTAAAVLKKHGALRIEDRAQ